MRTLVCPFCENLSLLLVPDVSGHRPVTTDMRTPKGTTSTGYLVFKQLCSCTPVTRVVLTEDEDGIYMDCEYTTLRVVCQPGSLGVDKAG